MSGLVFMACSGAAIAAFVAAVNWKKIAALFDDRSVESKDTAVLCVGMGVSKCAGKCPGADLDADRMHNVLKGYASGGITLLHGQKATYSAVMGAFREAVKHDLCIFYYSGHGGRDERDGKNRSGEEDMRDEYLCPYDRFIKDDEVWSVVQGAKGRVVLIFDCCHSGTMYRALDRDDPSFSMFTGAHPFTLRRFAKRAPEGATALREPNLLCWSAARENEYSYGGDDGGIFTNALLVSYDRKRTYSDVWDGIEKRMKGEPNRPVRTRFGEGFGGKVFK